MAVHGALQPLRRRRAAREGALFEAGESGADVRVACPPRQTEALLLRDLQRSLAQLPAEQRSVVLLVGLDGERYDTAAARLDIPIGTVRSRASRGRRALRHLMDGALPSSGVAAAS